MDPQITHIVELSERDLNLIVINMFEKTDDELENVTRKLESLN